MLLTTASPPPAQSVGAVPSAEAGGAVTGVDHTVAQEADAKGKEPEGGGLPQFKLESWGGQILWLVILFAALYLLLSRVFVPRLRKVKDEREEAIGGAIRAARAAQAESDALSKAADEAMQATREKVEAIIAEAKARSGAEAVQHVHALEAELAKKLEEAEGRIGRARDEAMSSVKDVAADAASAIVARLTGEAPPETEVQAALATARA